MSSGGETAEACKVCLHLLIVDMLSRCTNDTCMQTAFVLLLLSQGAQHTGMWFNPTASPAAAGGPMLVTAGAL